MAGYVFEEKVAIANKYLIPDTLTSHGVGTELVQLGPEPLAKLIRDYAREAGVRELRKLVEKIVRKVALKMVRSQDEVRSLTSISCENLHSFVGQPLYSSESMFPNGMPPGVARGLAWTALGGQTLFIETRGRLPAGSVAVTSSAPQLAEAAGAQARKAADDCTPEQAPPAKVRRNARGRGPRLKVTGQVGQVMSESSDIAVTYAMSHLGEVQPENSFLEEAAVHMNMPEGATPKDGPSAGVAMTSALLSLAIGVPVKQDLAMTGELTLSGKVLRVGGIKEKTVAARREDVKTIVFPLSNKADYVELKPHLRAGLTAHFVDHFDDVYRLAFADTDAPMPAASRGSDMMTVFTPPEAALNPEAVSQMPQ